MTRFDSCRLAVLLAAVTLVLGSVSCTRGFTINTPGGFAELEDQDDFAYRATSAEGVVIAVRREDNRPYGDLGFWSGAVDSHLRRQGYVARHVADVKSADGVAGRQVRYGRSQGGRDHAFWATVFVTDDLVIIVEAGGDQSYFEQREQELGAAIASLRIG